MKDARMGGKSQTVTKGSQEARSTCQWYLTSTGGSAKQEREGAPWGPDMHWKVLINTQVPGEYETGTRQGPEKYP